MKTKLSKDASILLAMGCLFMAGVMIASTFVNVYLLRLTGNMGLMILQTIANYFMILSGFLIGTYYTQKGGNMLNLLRIGIGSIMLYYTLILILKEKASTYLVFLGLLNGIGQGFYYFTFNILVGQLLNDVERPQFFGYQSSFSYIFGVLAPSISGAIIVRFSQLTGYYVLFGATVVVLVLSIIFSMQLRKVGTDQKYTIFPVLLEKGNKFWNLNKYVNFTNGVTQAIYGQIFTVFAYLIISDESIIGNLSSIMSLIGVVSSLFIASKFTTPDKQKKFHFLYCIGYMVALGGLGLLANKVSLYAAYIILGLVTCWYNVIYQNQKYQFSNRAVGKFTQSDYIITTEFPIAAGRISGLVIFFILNSLFEGVMIYRILLVAITFIPFLDHYVVQKAANWLREE